MSNSFFLVGISILVYLSFPLIYLLFGIKPLQTEDTLYWALHYLPFFALYYSLTWLLTGRLHLATVATALATFYPYILALLSVLLNQEQEWSVTTSKKSSQGYFLSWTWPHIMVIMMTPLAVLVGWYHAYDFWSTVLYSIWSLVNMYLLILFLTGERRVGIVKKERFLVPSKIV
jgi:hypothetical protein